jgi:trehalose 6-phosphate synthase
VAAARPTARSPTRRAASPLRLALDGEPRILGDGETTDREVAVRLVDVPAEVHEPFYGVIANPLLWFVQHRLHDLKTSPAIGREERSAFEDGYVEANRLAADAVVEQVERVGGAAIVLLHDYHFYLVGDLVRQRCPDAVISHFVHIPWPGPETWQVLPPDMRERLLVGLLGCDVVAFHTRADARAFVLCAQELLDLPGRPVEHDRAGVRPHGARARVPDQHRRRRARGAGLDRRLRRAPRRPRRAPVRRPARPARRPHRPEQEHRARVHRLRPAARGAPELHGRVQFLALLQPSRQDVPEYATYLADIGAAAASVNAKHGTGDWQPVDLRLASDMALATAAYRRCDVLVVNAVADGMNLVAKEAVVVNERDMVLALSEATGAHDELGSFAVTLHPFDVAQQADALHAALTMPAQLRRDRREHAAEVVHRNDVRRWLSVQLRDLADLRQA